MMLVSGINKYNTILSHHEQFSVDSVMKNIGSISVKARINFMIFNNTKIFKYGLEQVLIQRSSIRLKFILV